MIIIDKEDLEVKAKKMHSAPVFDQRGFAELQESYKLTAKCTRWALNYVLQGVHVWWAALKFLLLQFLLSPLHMQFHNKYSVPLPSPPRKDKAIYSKYAL